MDGASESVDLAVLAGQARSRIESGRISDQVAERFDEQREVVVEPVHGWTGEPEDESRRRWSYRVRPMRIETDESNAALGCRLDQRRFVDGVGERAREVEPGLLGRNADPGDRA